MFPFEVENYLIFHNKCKYHLQSVSPVNISVRTMPRLNALNKNRLLKRSQSPIGHHLQQQFNYENCKYWKLTSRKKSGIWHISIWLLLNTSKPIQWGQKCLFIFWRTSLKILPNCDFDLPNITEANLSFKLWRQIGLLVFNWIGRA